MSQSVESSEKLPVGNADLLAGTPGGVLDIDQVLRDREFNWDRPLPEAKPVYWIGEVPICTRGNLTTITGQAKTGKSSLLAAMAASTMTGGQQVDTLHFAASNAERLAVIHIDTEQDPQRHGALVRNIARRANLDRLPAWFHSYSAKGVPPDFLGRLLEAAMTQDSKKHGGMHSVLLDGIADLVVDPNRAEECFPFITWLEGLAVRYDTALVSALHLNPVSMAGSGSKSRGHLGSQLERKVETEIRLKKDSDGANAFWTSLARGQPINQPDALRFRWSEAHGYFVSADSKKDEKEANNLATKYREAQALMGNGGPVAYAELIRRMVDERKISRKGAEQRFTKLRAAGVLVEVESGWGLLPLNSEYPEPSTVRPNQID